MIDQHFDGDIYAALGADSVFNEAARAAKEQGKSVAIVSFGTLVGRVGRQAFGGRVAIALNPAAVRRRG